MKSGTPGFIGSRLRTAREARGLTASSLAELVGVTKASISLYETGGASPQPETLNNIIELLKLPVAYFLMPDTPKKERNPIFFRSMASATKTARSRGLRRYEWLSEIITHALKEYVKFPNVNFPRVETPTDFKKLSFDDIEKVASDVRRFWKLGDGPISNMVLLMENNGAVVTRIELYADKLDAFSTWRSSDKTPYIILGADKGSAVRSRFDAAHELGHLVLHRNIEPKHLNSASDFKLIEQQAHRFAGAFLIPANTFAKDFYAPTLDSFRVLKLKWLVAIGVIIRRARDLNFIDEQLERRLWINYNRRGWRRSEPLDEKIPVERPRLLYRVIETLLSEGALTIEQLLSKIALGVRDIEELTTLPSGYLNITAKDIEIIEDTNLSATRPYKGRIYSSN
jgi:Zn-dependent peptidase ImmA (M78 family)/DNA-binding XRE family transcriptional regulator